MADKGFQDRMMAYQKAIDESEKLFESKIEEYLISDEGGWTKADDSGYCNPNYKGMALDIVTLTDFVKATQPMAWRRFERLCTIDPLRQFHKAFDSAVTQMGCRSPPSMSWRSITTKRTFASASGSGITLRQITTPWT